MIRYLPLALFCLTIPAANWLIQNVGWQYDGRGPHLIPVAPGLMAPSGVLLIGAALLLRDMVQRALGLWWAVGAILAGGALSGLFAPGPLVVASVAAFLLSELADLAVTGRLDPYFLVPTDRRYTVIINDAMRLFPAGWRLTRIDWLEVGGRSWAEATAWAPDTGSVVHGTAADAALAVCAAALRARGAI